MDPLGFLFVMDPFFATILVGGILLGCGYFLGKYSGQIERDKIMSRTIDYLCAEGYLKYKELDDGDIELYKIEDKK
jgi:hypothetical protein